MQPVTFSATFHDGVTAVPQSVTVRVHDAFLHVEGAGNPLRWDMQGLTVEQPMQDGMDGIFSHSAHTDQQLVVTEKAYYTIISSRMREVQGVHIAWRMPVMVAALVAVLFVSVVYIIPYYATAFAPMIPKRIEASLGQGVYQQLTQRKPLCTQEAGQAALEKIVHRLAPDTPVTIGVVRDFRVNGFALPGGYVLLNNGLIRAAESPEEVAGIIAHELGHVHKYHVMERLLRAFGVGLVVDMFTGGGAVVTSATYMLDSQFSRENEREADIYGVALLHQRGVNPLGMAAFFERLAKRKNPPEWLELVSTHPDSLERMQTVRDWAAKNPESYTPVLTEQEWQDLRAICQKPKTEDAKK